LYLHGLALSDFELALRGLLGERAPLSKAFIARSRAVWELEFQEWRTRSLADLDIVYTWADGLYEKAGIDDGKAAVATQLASQSTLLAAAVASPPSPERTKSTLTSTGQADAHQFQSQPWPSARR
jgi:hypothetical protein